MLPNAQFLGYGYSTHGSFGIWRNFSILSKIAHFRPKIVKKRPKSTKNGEFSFFMKNSANLYEITSKRKTSQIRSFYTVLDHFKVKYYQKSRIFDFPAVWASFLRLVTSHKKINKKLNFCSIIKIFKANRSKRLVLT